MPRSPGLLDLPSDILDNIALRASGLDAVPERDVRNLLARARTAAALSGTSRELRRAAAPTLAPSRARYEAGAEREDREALARLEDATGDTIGEYERAFAALKAAAERLAVDQTMQGLGASGPAGPEMDAALYELASAHSASSANADQLAALSSRMERFVGGRDTMFADMASNLLAAAYQLAVGARALRANQAFFRERRERGYR